MSPIEIIIVDYGMGNISSVSSALRTLEIPHRASSDPDTIRNAKGLLLPGVGAFGEAIHNLHERKLFQPILTSVRDRRTPLLGICLGMQLLFERSSEKGDHHGLGLVQGEIVRIVSTPDRRVPHVGWNEVRVTQAIPLFQNLDVANHFYFDHSYHALCANELIAGTVDYGIPIVAAVAAGVIMGTQFHPEKSHKQGLRILRNFSRLVEAHAH